MDLLESQPQSTQCPAKFSEVDLAYKGGETKNGDEVRRTLDEITELSSRLELTVKISGRFPGRLLELDSYHLCLA